MRTCNLGIAQLVQKERAQGLESFGIDRDDMIWDEMICYEMRCIE
jgi:hypothetical protein